MMKLFPLNILIFDKERLRKMLCFVIAFFFVFSAVAQKSVKISVVPAGSIGVGEEFYIKINVRNIDAQPNLPSSLPGCKILYSALSASSTAVTVDGNGKSSRSSSETYTLTAKAQSEGSYSFGPVTVGGVKSNIVNYKIGKAAAASSGGNVGSGTSSGQPKLISKGDKSIFLRATVSNSNPYEQEGIVYTVKLYTTYSSVFDWFSTQAPKFANSTYEDTRFADKAFSVENYNGKTYRTAVVAKYIVFPTQSGKSIFAGNTFTGSVASEDYYSDPYFQTVPHMVTSQVEVKTNDVEINVKPLPVSPGGNSVNGVGQFDVTSSIRSDKLKAMQAFNIVYKVSGKGNLSFVSMPDLNSILSNEFKCIKTDSKIDKKVVGNNVEGTVTYTCTIIPQKEGDFELPEVDFMFFDPTTNQYVKKTAKGFKVKVGKGSVVDASVYHSSLKFDDALLPVVDLSRTPQYLISTWGYWMSYVCPLILLLIILAVYRRQVRLSADVVGQKNRKAGKVAKKRLRVAASCLKANRADVFYSEMLTALWGYLSDKLLIPTSELNRNNIADRLTSNGVNQTLVDSLITLIDDCEMAQYYSSHGLNMKSVYDRGAALIDALEKELSNPSVSKK